MNSTYQELMSHVRAARGLEPVDLLLQQCRLINVCSGEVHDADIAVHGSRIVAIREQFDGPAIKRQDCTGLFAAPGLVARITNEDRLENVAKLFTLGVTTVLVDEVVSATSDTYATSEHAPRQRLLDDKVRPLQPQTTVETLAEVAAALRTGTAVRLSAHGPETGTLLATLKRQGMPLTHIWLHPGSGADALLASLQQALQEGCTPAELYRMAAFTPAVQFCVEHELGCLAPGRLADILLLKTPGALPVRMVFDGALV